VEVKNLEGTAFGGICRATVRIEKVPGGAEVAGSVRLEGGKLEALASAARGTTSGPRGGASGEIAFSGKGTSPRSAIAALTGAGSLRLEEAALAGIWPGAVNAALDAALKAGPENLAATLRQSLVAGLSAHPAQLPRTLGLEISDGQLRIKPFAIETPEGRAAGDASLDLMSLTLESGWRLEQNPAAGPTPDKPALPPVVVSYRGPVSSASTLEPQVATEPLEREIAVRKMERDVEELERLRRLDEARRREEAERLRQQFVPLPPVPLPVPPAATPQARPAAPG
jgi:hypothetical protein